MATLKIGRLYAVGVDTLAQAVEIYCAKRDESGEGASTFPQGRYDGTAPIRPAKGKIPASVGLKTVTYRISYNGRVWDRDGSEVAF